MLNLFLLENLDQTEKALVLATSERSAIIGISGGSDAIWPGVSSCINVGTTTLKYSDLGYSFSHSTSGEGACLAVWMSADPGCRNIHAGGLSCGWI